MCLAHQHPYRYIPGYLKELQDGHAKELSLFKRKLYEVKDQLVCLNLSPRTYFYSRYARHGVKKLRIAFVNTSSNDRRISNCPIMKRLTSLGACSELDR